MGGSDLVAAFKQIIYTVIFCFSDGFYLFLNVGKCYHNICAFSSSFLLFILKLCEKRAFQEVSLRVCISLLKSMEKEPKNPQNRTNLILNFCNKTKINK